MAIHVSTSSSAADEGDFAVLTANADPGYQIALGTAGGKVMRAEAYRPVLVLGPQRSGKTTSVVIPAMLEWAGPAFVTSVRSDVWKETEKRRASLGRIYVYDPTGDLRNVPGSIGWSPLDGIQTWDGAVARAAGLCEGAESKGMKDGDFWVAKARQLMAPLIFAAAVANQPFGHVTSMLNTPRSLLVDAVESQLESMSNFEPTSDEVEICMNRLESATSMAEETWASVVATASQVLQVFDYLGVDRQMKGGGLHVAEFLDGGNHTLYLCAPARQQRLFRPLFTALTREIINLAYRINEEAPKGGEVKLLMCLDEAGNIARLEDLDVIATTAAGTKLQLLSVFHDMSQMQSCYGTDRASLIQNNHSALVCLPGNRDPRTNSVLVEMLSEEAVRGVGHRGWNFSDLRKMHHSMCLLVYASTPALLVDQRRDYLDAELKLLKV